MDEKSLEEKEYTAAEEEALLRTMNYASALDSVMDMDRMFSATFEGLDGAEEYGGMIDENDEEFKALSQLFRAPEIDFSMFDLDAGDPDYFCEDGEVAADVAKALGLF